MRLELILGSIHWMGTSQSEVSHMQSPIKDDVVTLVHPSVSSLTGGGVLVHVGNLHKHGNRNSVHTDEGRNQTPNPGVEGLQCHQLN